MTQAASGQQRTERGEQGQGRSQDDRALRELSAREHISQDVDRVRDRVDQVRQEAQGARQQAPEIPPPGTKLVQVVHRHHRRTGKAAGHRQDRDGVEEHRRAGGTQGPAEAELGPPPAAAGKDLGAGLDAGNDLRIGGEDRHRPLARQRRPGSAEVRQEMVQEVLDAGALRGHAAAVDGQEALLGGYQ